MCSNPIPNSCVWPLDTGRKDILGRSDVSTLQKIVHEKNKLSIKNDNFEELHSFCEKENLSNQHACEKSEEVRQGSPTIVQEFNKSSEKNQEKYQNLVENSEESPEILQVSSHDLSTNSVDPDAETESESEGIQEAIDPWGDIDTDFMSLPEMKIQEIKSVSEEKDEEDQENEEGEITHKIFDFPLRRPLISQKEAFKSVISSRKRKKNKKFQVQNWNGKENTDVFQKKDEWQNKEADSQIFGPLKGNKSTKKETSNSYSQYGVY